VPELSRSQLLVYGAIAVALLLVGARWIRAADGGGSDGGVASAAAGAPGESFELDKGGDTVVHVAGAVDRPGVYRLPAGSRVTDAIERAGGPTADAEADGINLAAPLADGQQVVVPVTAGSGAAAGASAEAADGPISLGTATVEELDTIDGIGPVTAQQIVDFRDEQGGVSSIDDLDQISGIGPVTMEALRTSLQP
jgi:competence protein ComEA